MLTLVGIATTRFRGVLHDLPGFQHRRVVALPARGGVGHRSARRPSGPQRLAQVDSNGLAPPEWRLGMAMNAVDSLILFFIVCCKRVGPVAQRLEQRTHNPLVPGSNPGGPTTSSETLCRSRRRAMRSQTMGTCIPISNGCVLGQGTRGLPNRQFARGHSGFSRRVNGKS